MKDPKEMEKWVRECQELLKTDPKKAREMLDRDVNDIVKSYPVLAIMGLVALRYLMSSYERPKWLKDCAPVHGRRNGAWRGKGSFGKGFGANKVRHK